jgi:mannose-6-phosphate isomerase-like protein (cupin superfamily)
MRAARLEDAESAARPRRWRRAIVKRARRKTKRKIGAAAATPAAAVPAKMYRTNMHEVPKVAGLKRKDGWVDMQVQFLIDKRSAGADHVIGWTVLKPGARHERHRHHKCDEFFIVLKGRGHIYTDEGEAPSGEGDVVYSPRTCWHGFNNTSNEDVVLVWGWMGAGSIEASGYEVAVEN